MSTTELLQSLRDTVSSSGDLNEARPRLLALLQQLEASLSLSVSSASTSTSVLSGSKVLDPSVVRANQQEKLLKFLQLIPDKRMSKAPSPFMINELMPVPDWAAAARAAGLKTGRAVKKGTRPYDKRVEELRKLLQHMHKSLDNEVKVLEDAETLHKLLLSDASGETLFFECEGQRLVEAMLFSPNVEAGSMCILLALFFFILKLPTFQFESVVRGKPSFAARLVDVFGRREELQVQRAALFMLATLAEMAGNDALSIVLEPMNVFQKDHPQSLHPIGIVVDIMVTYRDGVSLAAGLKLVNALIKAAEHCNQQDSLNELLQASFYHHAMVQFTTSSSAQSLEGVAAELKKYQAWFLRASLRKKLAEKFSLAEPDHRNAITTYWSLRHKDVPCPIKSDNTFDYSDSNKDLWADIGFFNEPSTYLTVAVRMYDLLNFAQTRTNQWLGILDKLAGTRKIAEKAKAAAISKIDYDVVGVSVGLTQRILEICLAPSMLIPAQRILWTDSGRMAIHAAGMEMARTVFTGYKAFDRNNTKQILEDVMQQLVYALQSNPATEDYLHRLVAFLGSRSKEEDRTKTLRGATGMGNPEKKASQNLLPGANRDANAIKEAIAAAAGAGSAAAWKTQFSSLYRQSLEDFEPGAGGVPAVIISLTEAILSCGGESSVGLFRLQPSSEALAACEERLDAGGKGIDVFRTVSDPNIPGMILKRILTALDPPLIEKYNAVLDAMRLNQFGLLLDILKKIDPISKATLNYLMNFLRYLSDLSDKTKMDASNVAMVFAPTIMRDPERADRPSFGASFLEKDVVLYLMMVVDKIPE